MRWRYIFYIVGILTLILGLTMIFPILVGAYFKDGSVSALLKSLGITIISGLAAVLIFKSPPSEIISSREGMAIVSIGWICIGFFGSLPFYLSGEFGGSFTNAYFESVSGFTTTGASILTDIESVPKGLLFWRSFIQWLGGMGIIVLSVAILPFLGVGGMELYKAEVPSPVPDKLKPRIRDTAMIMWKIYAGISGIEVIFLMLGGMNLYESMCHAFTTMPTGGFSTRNASIAHYDSAYIDTVIVIFMLIAGINFSLHYQLLRGKTLAFWKDSECRFFLITFGVLTLIVSLDIFSIYSSFGKSVRYASFQIASIVTTTGFATADYEQWPAMSQVILFLCMFLGASAGSTGGGMKCIRVMLACKYCYKELLSLIHPHAVFRIKIGGKPVSEDIMRSILGFLGLYMLLYAVSIVVLAGLGVDFVTSLSAVAATLGNIGPGFGSVGPTENFAHIPTLGKWLLIWCMLLGRLEIYTLIILLVPEFWKK